jgi:hypothetical protein
MGLAGLQVDPATAAALGTGLAGIQPHQLAHAQAAAVQQLDHGGIARLQPGVGAGVVAARRTASSTPSALGSGLGCLGRAHVLHRVVRLPGLAPGQV